MSVAAELSFEVPRDERGPALSRAAVRDSFGGRISARELEDLLVIVSELVTNAVRYGSGEICVRARLEDGVVHGEVVDEGSGFERTVERCGIEALGGNGLPIVAALARRWGIHEGSSHVWFELMPDDAAAPVGPRRGEEHRPAERDELDEPAA
ncbi:MAG: serine/threonine-protein kinase RsbW [Candidatus Eremiobacteraeota bacterium]|nr:serine/threonine-protein kinase RsbW [Candidatus Eremiobacteraeota bacterium]